MISEYQSDIPSPILGTRFEEHEELSSTFPTQSDFPKVLDQLFSSLQSGSSRETFQLPDFDVVLGE